MSCDEPDYPMALRAVYAPPIILYVQGTLADDTDAVAIVGSRGSTVPGRVLARSLAQLRDRATRCLDNGLRRADDGLRHTLARLRALSPKSTLQRGYAIVQRADGHVVRAADEVKTDDLLRVRLADGELRATVQEPQ